MIIYSPRDLKKKPQLKRQMSVSSLILTWCKDVTQEYEVTSNGTLEMCVYNKVKIESSKLWKLEREELTSIAPPTPLPPNLRPRMLPLGGTSVNSA